MVKRKIAIAGATIFLGASISPLSWAQTKSPKNSSSSSSASQQRFVAAIPSPSKTVTSSVQPSSSNKTPPAHLSSALGLGPKSKIHIDGFMSAGIAWTDASSNYFIPNHGLIDNTLSATPLSLIGLQFTADLAHNLQVVTQFVGDGDNANGNVAYRVTVQWAFLRYVINDNYQVQVGRFRLPAFLYSQTEQVGYSYPWVILPNEVYRIVPFQNLNGITFLTRHPMGSSGWNLTTQSYYGSNASKFTVYNTAFPDGITVDFTESAIGGTVVGIANRNFTIRATYAHLSLTGNYEGLSPIIPAVTLFSKASTKFYSVGAKALLGHFVFIGEYSDRDTPANIAALQGYYGALGYHIGKLLPLFTYAHIKTTNASALMLVPSLSENPQDQQSYTLSLDYTLNSNLVIKGSVSQISPLNGTFGLFNSDPKRRQVYLYGLSLDAIF